MKGTPQPRRRSSTIALAALATLGAMGWAHSARAADRQWIGVGTGNWNTAGNWASSNIPGAGDIADIVNADGVFRIVLYDYPGPPVTLDSVLLSNTGGALTQLVMNGNALSATNATIGGAGGRGVFNLGGGAFTLSGQLFLGGGGGTGTFNLAGTGVFTCAGQENIGSGGTGVFTQSGGTNNAQSLMDIGIGGPGTYNLQDGVVFAGAEDIAVFGSNGTLNQSGGVNNPGVVRVGAFGTGGIGIVNMSGGTLNTGDVLLGGFGTSAVAVGILNATGGTMTLSGGITVYNASVGTNVSSVTINGGTVSASFLTAPNWNSFTFTKGTLTLSGGTSSNAGGLVVGLNNAGAGLATLNLNAGLLFSATEVNIGQNGNGMFVQSGGAFTAAAQLDIGNSGFNGAYQLLAGTLSAGAEDVAVFEANGLVSQSGGQNSMNDLRVGSFGAGGRGTVNVSAGSLTANNTILLGGFGTSAVATGILNVSGGTVTVGNYIQLYGTTGSAMNISGGSVTTPAVYFGGQTHGSLSGNGILAVNGEEAIGPSAAVFTQTGGSNQIFGALTISGSTSGTSTYSLQGGSLSSSYGEYVGYQSGGTGIFNQSAGNNNIAVLFSLGTVAGASGTVNLSGGSLTVANVAVGGNFGTVSGGAGLFNVSGNATLLATNITVFNTASSFNLTGGTVTTAAIFTTPDWGRFNFAGGTLNLTGGVSSNGGDLTIGSGGTVAATLNLSGGTLAVGNFEFIGSGVAGTFNQTGGVHDPTYLHVAEGAGVRGTYNLIAGALNDTGDMRIATGGIGSFVQSGGTATVNGNNLFNSYGLGIGEQAAASGSYTLIAGVLSVSNSEFIGSSGSGTFSQTSGAHTVGAAGAGSIYLGGSGFGSGGHAAYVLGGGALSVHDTEFVGFAGAGQLIQSGGTNTASGLTVAANPGASGTVQLSGGVLTIASATVNNGTFNQTGGVSSLGAVSGTGSLSVGNGAGTTAATMHVSQFAQNSVSIGNNGTIFVTPAIARVTNTTTALTITGTGLLDLGNHALLVDNSATPESAVRQYLHNAYNADASGIGNWLGKGGITSSDAIASHNGTNPDFRISVGYVNGAYANDPLIGGSIPGQATLPTNRTLIRPALYGDLNLDGKVDDTDLAILSGLGQYNQPSDKFGWLGGDLNQDGKVDDTDLLIFSGAGNYNGPTYGAAAAGASHTSATPSLTGHTEANGDIVLSAATSQGIPGDGVLDFVYDPSTGHLTLSYDGDPRVTSAQPFQVVRFKSVGGHFIPANFNQTDFGAGVTATATALNGTASGSNSVPDGYDMGAVLPTGLTIADLTSDLTLQWNVFGGGLTLKNGDVVVPEPSIAALLSLVAAVQLTARRRRRTAAAS